ncbi:hydroxyacylglutathione hydrolase [Marinicella sp. W31]|uniref:hydroxyacylglutathione hydrolase n=1 Tax=Marinicella sp. W31 TaxID=3023713 RepID=UPI0037583E4B
MIKIHPVPAFNDNYIWVIHDHTHALIVDPGESQAVLDYLHTHQLQLTAILITHHHYDHINGVEEILKHHPQADVFAPEDERIPCSNTRVHEGSLVQFTQPEISLHVLETPGHTLSHIVYHNDAYLFCGDTLFSLGCGRLFEGTPEQMLNSLNKIKNLPKQLKVYCTHEYTLDNIRFTEAADPENPSVGDYKQEVLKLRAQNLPSLPTNLARELSLNPFLRSDDVKIQSNLHNALQITVEDEVATFAALRSWKDRF